jgi:hypothetical protein
MIATGNPGHKEAWLALPWLASGRLSPTDRDKLEAHVRACAACREELAFQRLLCNALTEPDRVTYAPGPSFRKLMDRIDGTERRTRPSTESLPEVARPRRTAAVFHRPSLWRPPGLAWAASFILMMGLAGVVTTVRQATNPSYTTRSDVAAVAGSILHVAFHRSVTVGEEAEVLRANGAHIVEGPDSVGIFGIAPGLSGLEASADSTPERMSRQLRVLSARLRADPRVRWVEPVPGEDTAGDAQTPTPRGP